MRERYRGRVTYRLDRISSLIAVGALEVFVECGSSRSRPLRPSAQLSSVIWLYGGKALAIMLLDEVDED